MKPVSDRVSHNPQCEASKVSNAGMGSMASHSLNQCEGTGFGECEAVDCSKVYNTRLVYNSSVIPKQVDALLTRRPVKNCVNVRKFKSRNVWCSGNALLYKVDVSHAFRHVKVNPGNYDLLGLEWGGCYVNTCIPFGMRNGSQIFQRLSDGIRFMMRQKGYTIIDYIDDYVGVGIPSITMASYAALIDLMNDLGLTISQKKLVYPSMQVTCLGVLIDTVNGTISIPPDKLRDVTDTVRQWLERDIASKRELQSILGLLLYVHKCIKPARIFLNRMLDLLRFAHRRQKVTLTSDCKRDLRWFSKFLLLYNGVSLYDHRPIDVTLELDACLTGLGGRSGSFIYHLPIVKDYMNWTIVHLGMVNILLL